MKQTPGTSLSVLFVWALLAYAGFVVYPKVAMSADVQTNNGEVKKLTQALTSMQGSLQAVDVRLRYDAMRRDMEQVEAEISATDREIQRVQRSGQEVSDFLIDRQRGLASRRTEIATRINALVQSHPELVNQ